MNWRTKNEKPVILPQNGAGAERETKTATTNKKIEKSVEYLFPEMAEVTVVPVQSTKLTNKFYLYLCGKCGQEVKVTDNFCSCCGSRLGWANDDE